MGKVPTYPELIIRAWRLRSLREWPSLLGAGFQKQMRSMLQSAHRRRTVFPVLRGSGQS